ncbi:hypothetical protein FI667_g3499, partial [Globisporangium splendens]
MGTSVSGFTDDDYDERDGRSDHLSLRKWLRALLRKNSEKGNKTASQQQNENGDDVAAFLRSLGATSVNFTGALDQEQQQHSDAAACVRKLARITNVHVVAVVEGASVARRGRRASTKTLVTLRLELTSSAPQLQRVAAPSSVVSSSSLNGARVDVVLPAIRSRHELTRPFDELRKLRKILAFCVRRKQHNGTAATETECAYCCEVRAYVRHCWEQPPLLATSTLSSVSTIRKSVLANSMTHFVRLAILAVPSAPTFSTQQLHGISDAAAHPEATDKAEVPPPRCAAQQAVATILHDFFFLLPAAA